MEIDKDGVKWYTKKELMELLKTAERVPMRNFNPYNIREMKFMLAKFCHYEFTRNDGCKNCALKDECYKAIPEYYKYKEIDNLVDWLLAQDTDEELATVEKLFNKLMDEGVL